MGLCVYFIHRRNLVETFHVGLQLNLNRVSSALHLSSVEDARVGREMLLEVAEMVEGGRKKRDDGKREGEDGDGGEREGETFI